LRPILPAIIAVCLGLACAGSARAEPVPRLKWERPVRCMEGPDGQVLRIQCDDDAHPTECLVAPNTTAEKSELHRVNECVVVPGKQAYSLLGASGARLVTAVAEAPPGFSRSDRGRAYQTKFDLLDRVYVGVGWAPVYTHGGDGKQASGFPFGRAQAELGMDASVLSPRGRSRHDFEVLQGTATFTDLHFNGQVFAYDYQQVHRRPVFWLTTFFGPPHLYPAAIPLGVGFRVFNIDDRPPSARNTLDMEFLEAHVSWNPIQSADMYNRLRLEAGADFGKAWPDRTQLSSGLGGGRFYAGFTSALRSRLSLGEGGLHYLFADLAYLRPTLIADGDLPVRSLNRFKGQLAYEGVLVAINDQPVSLRLQATGAVRDDLAGGSRNVEVGGNAGLRFSFWAPPRVTEPLPELEDP
jgi:hypothetical protein